MGLGSDRNKHKVIYYGVIKRKPFVSDMANIVCKAEKIPITLTFSENSNYWQESLLEVIRQIIAGGCQQTFCSQKFVDNAQQCFAFTSQANFLAHNLNFH